jgi:hypothetical protein
MTPFIDAGGFRWLRRVFEAAQPPCHKILILRDTDRYTVELGVEHAEWLRRLLVSVRDYHLSHDAAAGRTLPIETFHAKLVVADDSLAYALARSLGDVFEGPAAAPATRLRKRPSRPGPSLRRRPRPIVRSRRRQPPRHGRSRPPGWASGASPAAKKIRCARERAARAVNSRASKTEHELDEWLASPEGKAATAFESTPLPRWMELGRRS